ncbi:MAG: HNH endonuclease [bacterium]|nr:HNH endonuclease [bacterium]
MQIHVHERGGKLLVPTNQGERKLGPADTERLQCDAIICRKGRRAKATIPPRIRREVLARDGHRCQSPGCDRTHFLEVHHRTPRAKGGTHDPANLITLCASCHRLHHEKGSLVREPFLALRSKVPGDLAVGRRAVRDPSAAPALVAGPGSSPTAPAARNPSPTAW